LLADAGIGVSVEETDRPRLPALLLGVTTQKLIGDVFGESDWLKSLPRIEKRIVAWGPDAEPLTVPHFAVMISEKALAERLRPRIPAGILEPPQWTFYASRPLPFTYGEYRFGTRRAATAAVELKPGSDPSACWIESLENGWLFLVPGWLLAVGDSPERLLARSRLIAAQVQKYDTAHGGFPAYPRILDPLCGPGWLCGGAAALAFDPLCGDGTGHAIREGILASAVFRASAGGLNTDDLIAHYRARLVAGFRRHLEVCREFYRTGGTGEWWRTELDLIHKGISWCGEDPPFRFQLTGFDLVKS
jgi:hypothetical protein